MDSGERTASALEDHLTSLEQKIDGLLAAAEGQNTGSTAVNSSSKQNNHGGTEPESAGALDDSQPDSQRPDSNNTSK